VSGVESDGAAMGRFKRNLDSLQNFRANSQISPPPIEWSQQGISIRPPPEFSSNLSNSDRLRGHPRDTYKSATVAINRFPRPEHQFQAIARYPLSLSVYTLSQKTSIFKFINAKENLMILVFVFFAISLMSDILSRLLIISPLDSIALIHLPTGLISIFAICLLSWLLGD
jgi:hypothetical protein